VRVVIGGPPHGPPGPPHGQVGPIGAQVGPIRAQVGPIGAQQQPETTHEAVASVFAGDSQRRLADELGFSRKWVRLRLQVDGPTARELEAVDRLLRARGLRLAIVPAEEDPS